MKTGYITITEELNGQNLTPSEKIALALVRGFCQDHQGVFYGSLAYIQHWLECSKPTAISTMSGLVEKGLLVRGEIRDRRGRHRTYSIPEDGKEILPGEGKDFLPEDGKEILPEGGKEALPNNTSIDNKNIDNNNPLNNSPLTIEEKVAALQDEFVEKVAKFRDKYAPAMLQAFIDYWAAPLQNPTKAQIKAGTLLNYQTQRTWDLAGRLRTWARNDARFTARDVAAGRSFGPRLNSAGETATVSAFRAAGESLRRLSGIDKGEIEEIR